MRYHNIAIMIHRTCTAACESCCVEASPDCKEQLDINHVKRYISSSATMPNIKSIAFTGGEPFLYYDKLKDLIAFVHGIGKEASAATNGFWASSYEIAYSRLSELKRIGLTQVGVSCDSFHTKYIDVNRISNILLAANDLEIPTALNLVIARQHPVGDIIDRLQDSIKEAQIMIFPCQAVGNAKINLKDEDYIRTRKSKGCYCKKSGGFSIDYAGRIWPCCSPYVFNTDLSIGNYEILNLPSTIDKLRNNRILYILRNFGFDYFINIAENELGMEVPEYIISACELCSLFFSKQNIYKFYPYVYDTIAELINRNKEIERMNLELSYK